MRCVSCLQEMPGRYPSVCLRCGVWQYPNGRRRVRLFVLALVAMGVLSAAMHYGLL